MLTLLLSIRSRATIHHSMDGLLYRRSNCTSGIVIYRMAATSARTPATGRRRHHRRLGFSFR